MAQTAVREKMEALAVDRSSIPKLQVKNILCPVDFSVFSTRALDYGINLARHFGSHLYIQHTIEPNYVPMSGPDVNLCTVDAEIQLQSARAAIQHLLITHGIDTSEVTVLLSDGDVYSRIVNTISKDRIDLVVMGTHGHRGVSRLALGSVAERIIHKVACPVLVVCKPQGDFIDPLQGERPRTILLATDFSSESGRALAYALKWGCEWNARVVLFHAVPHVFPGVNGMVDLFPEYNPCFESQLARAWAAIHHLVPGEAARCNIVYEVRQGNPREEILHLAKERGADLIVTGARGAGGADAPWGSVSSTVARNGRFPVLIVPERPV